MRLVKMLGLAVVATMAAMAFVGATSASATETELCDTHTELACSEEATTVSMVNSGSGRLLSDLVDVICDSINATGTPLALASPQSVHVSGLDFESCETSGGDGCVVSVLEQPLVNLLKTGLDQGTLTNTNGLTLVECEDVFFSIDIHCVYDGTGLEFPVGAQHLTASSVLINTASGELCPEESFLDGLLVTTQNRFVLAPPPPTALCISHKAKACPKGELVTEVHFVADKPFWDIETKGGKKHTVQCAKSLLKGDVGSLRGWQRITVKELTWTECKLDGVDACEVETVLVGLWRVSQKGLNTGVVVVQSSVEIICGKTIECELAPTGMWTIEGATAGPPEHKGKIIVKKGAAGGGGEICPKGLEWNATYESLDKIYVLE